MPVGVQGHCIKIELSILRQGAFGGGFTSVSVSSICALNFCSVCVIHSWGPEPRLCLCVRVCVCVRPLTSDCKMVSSVHTEGRLNSCAVGPLAVGDFTSNNT